SREQIVSWVLSWVYAAPSSARTAELSGVAMSTTELKRATSMRHSPLWGLPATTVMVTPRAVPMAPFGLLDNRECRASSMDRISGRCRVGLAHRDEHYCPEHGADTKYRFHLDDSRYHAPV